MKYLFKISTFFVAGLCIVLCSIFYQRCQPVRQCHLLKGVDFMAINASSGDTLLALDTVNATNFQLQIHLNDQPFSCKNIQLFPFVQSANATSIYVENIFYDTVKHITITSNQNYDNTHPAGSSLNDIFQIPSQLESFYDVVTFFQYSIHLSPDHEGIQQFHVVVDVSNSAPYDTLFPPFYFKP